MIKSEVVNLFDEVNEKIEISNLEEEWAKQIYWYSQVSQFAYESQIELSRLLIEKTSTISATYLSIRDSHAQRGQKLTETLLDNLVKADSIVVQFETRIQEVKDNVTLANKVIEVLDQRRRQLTYLSSLEVKNGSVGI